MRDTDYTDSMRSGLFRFDTDPADLPAPERKLFEVLSAEPHRVFTKEELLRDVWGPYCLGRTRTLDAAAVRLRRKLDADHGRFVRNCWGIGYSFV